MNSRWLALSAALALLPACVTTTSTGKRPETDNAAAVANMNLGAGYLRQGRFDLAIERLERALELDPRLADAHSTIAIAYDRDGRLEVAESHYRRATELEPDNGAVANNYAVFLCRQNRWRDAEPHFRRAAASRDYAAEVALTNAGACAVAAGEPEQAEQQYRAALEQNPRFPDALAGMVELGYRGGNYLQARAFVQRYLDAAPPTAVLLWLCFNIERRLNDTAASDRCALRLREGFPESIEVRQLEEYLSANGR